MYYLVKVYQNNKNLCLSTSGTDGNRPMVDQFLIAENDAKKIVSIVESNKAIMACDNPVKITIEEMRPYEGGFRSCWEVNFEYAMSLQLGLIQQFEDGTFRIFNDQGVSDEELDSWTDQRSDQNVVPSQKHENEDVRPDELDQKPIETKEQYQNRLMDIVAQKGGPDFRKKET